MRRVAIATTAAVAALLFAGVARGQEGQADTAAQRPPGVLTESERQALEAQAREMEERLRAEREGRVLEEAPAEEPAEGAAGEDAVDGMQGKLEGGHDTEADSGATQCPEQLRVLIRADTQHRAIGRHHLSGEEVVAGKAVLPHQPADPSAESEPSDSG